ncbi:hypothetical protein [Staphylococcus aureus]|uniref:hypothetical protein n=1 Tax=Staphylococcaceae TaxID=90964 RepID=UPI0004501A6C|nr:hypothetical protein [Staphylococcus aureus]EZX74404.1 hypothetical protein V110_02688 [Staphylococcus aureus Chi-8]MBZ5280608.1 hypothetical protein [Staphylococcus aureus]MDG6736525.1 hypothetical protein [Staphylococcus aureus]HDE3760427.1 hypothetical protein [Staphylococcus aureus]HDE6087061.1 hypothetical protein [Staphylococcus aureus]
MSEEHIENQEGQPNMIYGFKTHLRQKKTQVEIRLDKVDKYNIPYAMTGIRIIYAILMTFAVVLPAFFLLVGNFRRALYIAPFVIILVIGLLIYISLFMFVFPSFGSLFSISINLFKHILHSRKVRKGKSGRNYKTGLEPVRDDGRVMYSSGKIGQFLEVDGRTSLTAYPSEILSQEIVAAKYHNNRNRNTTEKLITSSQRQNTEEQLKNLKALHETNENEAIKEMIDHQYRYIDSEIEGVATTFVQYLLLISDNERHLDDSLETLEASYIEGLYHGLSKLDKEETEQFLEEFKGLK